MMNRVKAVYLEVGGEQKKIKRSEMHTFEAKKSLFLAHLFKISEMVDTRDKFTSPDSAIEVIKIKNLIRLEFDALKDELDDLVKTNDAEVKKAGASMTYDKDLARKAVLLAISDEFRTLHRRVHGYEHETAESATQAGAGMATLKVEDVMKGKFAGAGVKTQREALTGEHMQKLAQIAQQTTEQDAILDEISKTLDELKEVATNITDMLQYHEKLIQDLDKKADQTQAKMDKVSARLQRASDQLNDKATNFCMYGICFLVLLGVAAVVYNMLIKK